MSRHHDSGQWTSADRKHWRPIIAGSLPAPCPHCHEWIHPGEQFDIDHLIPLSRGGSSSPDNLAASHVHCNRRAGGRAGRAQQLGRSVSDHRGEVEW